MLPQRLVASLTGVAIALAACDGQAATPASSPAAAPASAPAPASAVASAPAKASAAASGSAAAKPASAAPASGLTPLKSAYVVLSTHTLPSWIADDQGYFKQQGLDVQLTYIAGSTVA